MKLSRLIINDEEEIIFRDKSYVPIGPGDFSPNKIFTFLRVLKKYAKDGTCPTIPFTNGTYRFSIVSNNGFEYPIKIRFNSEGKISGTINEELKNWIDEELLFPGECLSNIDSFVKYNGLDVIGFEGTGIKKDEDGQFIIIHQGGVELPATENETLILNLILTRKCDCLVVPNYFGRIHELLWRHLVLDILPKIHKQVIVFGWDNKLESSIDDLHDNWNII